jgi:hypothetical protein
MISLFAAAWVVGWVRTAITYKRRAVADHALLPPIAIVYLLFAWPLVALDLWGDRLARKNAGR